MTNAWHEWPSNHGKHLVTFFHFPWINTPFWWLDLPFPISFSTWFDLGLRLKINKKPKSGTAIYTLSLPIITCHFAIRMRLKVLFYHKSFWTKFYKRKWRKKISPFWASIFSLFFFSLFLSPPCLTTDHLFRKSTIKCLIRIFTLSAFVISLLSFLTHKWLSICMHSVFFWKKKTRQKFYSS